MQHIGLPRALDMKDAEELIERVLIELRENNGITCAKILESDDTLIGTIGYYRLQKTHHRGEVGYMLHSQHWRKGIMSEALRVAAQCGFRRFGFHRIEAITDPRNEASNALLIACGFQREGFFRENYRWNEKFMDCAVDSLLAAQKDHTSRTR